MNICVFGASSESLAPEFYLAAEELGRCLARNGHTLVYGAGLTGLMGAVARGVQAEGGHMVGVSPRYFDEPGVLNHAYGELLFTDTLRERKQLMDDRSEAIIALPGGIGTFDELFEMLTLKQIGQHSKPIALLNTLGCYEPLRRLLQACADGHFMQQSVMDSFSICATPEETLVCVEQS